MSDAPDFMKDFLASIETRTKSNLAAKNVRDERQAQHLASVHAALTRKAAQTAKKTKRVALRADAEASTCFDELSFRAGTVFATFTDGSEYTYDMSKAEAKEWFDDPSLGGYFNAVVR